MTSVTKKKLGDEIKRRREARGLSRRELADALGTSELNVYRWETGRNEPKTKKHRTALRDVLQIEIGSLVQLANRTDVQEIQTIQLRRAHWQDSYALYETLRIATATDLTQVQDYFEAGSFSPLDIRPKGAFLYRRDIRRPVSSQ